MSALKIIKTGAKMNPYLSDNTCPFCKKIGEVIYHQGAKFFSCQICGKNWGAK